MGYAIDERNSERQHLLAKMLNPLTRQVLDRIPLDSVAKMLDLGCGRGHTTRMLAGQFPNASATGFEYDAALVAQASADLSNPPRIAFQQGDASRLPFPIASFDLVFTRYMLVHVPDPLTVIREMFRVTRPGGFVVAYEPDGCIEFCYPPNAVMERMSYLWRHLFPHPLIGRQASPSVSFRRRCELLGRGRLGDGPRPGYLSALVSHDRGSRRPRCHVEKADDSAGIRSTPRERENWKQTLSRSASSFLTCG